MDNNPLGTVLDRLENLTFDDLRDLLDMFAIADDRPFASERRKGLQGGIDNVLRTPAARAAWREIKRLAHPIDRKNAERVIVLLHAALEPKAGRKRRRDSDRTPLARGTVQVKSIPRKRLNLETMEVETIYYRYVYIRVWVTAGGADKLESRLKSIYVPGSRELAFALDAADPDTRAALVRRILDAYHNGTLEQLVDEYSDYSAAEL